MEASARRGAGWREEHDGGELAENCSLKADTRHERENALAASFVVGWKAMELLAPADGLEEAVLPPPPHGAPGVLELTDEF